MEVVYAQEEAPLHFTKSVFLVGPTPRSSDVESWRPAMFAALEAEGFDGVIFCPEPRNADWKGNYDDQVSWESAHLELADLILAWIPRKIPDMPAFTTNVEFGEWLRSGKLLYGRPDWAEKCRYLDHKYREHGHEPYDNISSLAKAAVERLGEGALRRDGERHISLHIWQTEAFQAWYDSNKRREIGSMMQMYFGPFGLGSKRPYSLSPFGWKCGSVLSNDTKRTSASSHAAILSACWRSTCTNSFWNQELF